MRGFGGSKAQRVAFRGSGCLGKKEASHKLEFSFYGIHVFLKSVIVDSLARSSHNQFRLLLENACGVESNKDEKGERENSRNIECVLRVGISSITAFAKA